jgi:hypothetical protein
MSDLLLRLAERTLGAAPALEPLLVPRFAPVPPGFEADAGSVIGGTPAPGPAARARTREERLPTAEPDAPGEVFPASSPAPRRERTASVPAPALPGDTAARPAPHEPAADAAAPKAVAADPPLLPRSRVVNRDVPVDGTASDDERAGPDRPPAERREHRPPAAPGPAADRVQSTGPSPHPAVPRPAAPRPAAPTAVRAEAGTGVPLPPSGHPVSPPRTPADAEAGRRDGKDRFGRPADAPSGRRGELDAPLLPLHSRRSGEPDTHSRQEPVGRAPAPAGPAPVRVTIGRVEVRATLPARPPAPAPAWQPPILSLDEYLRGPGGR